MPRLLCVLVLTLSCLGTACSTAPDAHGLRASGQRVVGGHTGTYHLQGRGAGKTTVSMIPVSGRPFKHAFRAQVHEARPNDYEIQLALRSTEPVAKGQTLLLRVWIRAAASNAESGEGLVTYVFERASDPWTKSLRMSAFGVTPDWMHVEIPFVAKEAYAAGEAQATLAIGRRVQTLDVGGLEVLKFGPEVAVEDLPKFEFTYEGREHDAAWREAAAERIRKYRMAPIAVEVVDARGKPIPGAGIDIAMTRHAFPFGSTYNAAMWSDEPDAATAERYRKTFAEMFNAGVPEWTMKWKAWENPTHRAWGETALAWMEAQGMTVRGHCMVWPSYRRSPTDLPGLAEDPAAMRRRVLDRIDAVGQSYSGRLLAWDVVNEPFSNYDLLRVLGDEALVEWFQAAHAADPHARLVLNETTNGSMRGGVDNTVRLIRLLQAQGAPIHAVGLQSHFGMSGIGMSDTWELLELYGKMGVRLEITEFDVEGADAAYQADYTRDYMTLCFSHPQVDSFMHWGFWEGKHWKPERALMDRGWNLRPNGQAYMDLVFGAWWTEESGQSDRDGRLTTRGFWGEYALTVTLPDGRTVERTFVVDHAGARVRVVAPEPNA